MTTIRIELNERSYDITVGEGAIAKASELFSLDRRVLIVTDSGVPKEYSVTVKDMCREGRIITVKEGEETKSLSVLEKIFIEMSDFGITRGDAVVAVGGGVVGDLAGFAAASYMRGIDFYNIPTTLLSMVDSSIGGKTAVNLGGIKNIVGAFYQPKGVIIDPALLKTLPKRHISNGLSESVKMAMTSDRELFELFEKKSIDDIYLSFEEIIKRSLMIKKSVVEQDEKELGLRRILNFGHTIGHGIESECGLTGLYHGECVALGMIPMCEGEERERLISVLRKLSLPTEYSGNLEHALAYVKHDKKSEGGGITAVFVRKIGEYNVQKIDISDLYTIALKSGICK